MARPPKKMARPPRLPGQKFAFVSVDQIFDAEYADKYGISKRVRFEQNPDLRRDRLIKGAILALADYNKQNLTDYQFVNIEMATWKSVAGTLYYITFAAKNAHENENEYTSFQATVVYDRYKRHVDHIRMKGSSTWCTGRLSEPV